MAARSTGRHSPTAAVVETLECFCMNTHARNARDRAEPSQTDIDWAFIAASSAGYRPDYPPLSQGSCRVLPQDVARLSQDVGRRLGRGPEFKGTIFDQPRQSVASFGRTYRQASTCEITQLITTVVDGLPRDRRRTEDCQPGNVAATESGGRILAETELINHGHDQKTSPHGHDCPGGEFRGGSAPQSSR